MFRLTFYTDYSYTTPSPEVPIHGTYEELSHLAAVLCMTFGLRPHRLDNLNHYR
jgi:hypothetical protein